METLAGVESAPDRTTWWRRFGATVIDIALAWILSSLAGFVWWVFQPLVWCAFVAWNNVYELGLEGDSIGRRVMRYQILDEITYEPIGLNRATVRFFGSTIDVALLGLGYLIPLFNKDRLRIADMLARSAPFDEEGLEEQSRRQLTIASLVCCAAVVMFVWVKDPSSSKQLSQASRQQLVNRTAQTATNVVTAYVEAPAAHSLPDGLKVTDVAVWQVWAKDAAANEALSSAVSIKLISKGLQTHSVWRGSDGVSLPISISDVAQLEVSTDGAKACVTLHPGRDGAGLLKNEFSSGSCS